MPKKKSKYSYFWSLRIRTIKKRDNYTCQNCGYLGMKDDGKLDVHHIDSNKKNNNDYNLITLCKKCHLTKEFEWYREALLEWQGSVLKEYYGRSDIFKVATEGRIV